MAGRRILIIDDTIGLAGELAARLIGLGYETVATTAAGSDIAATATMAGPELVLIKAELHTALHDGPAVDAIRRHRDLPVVVMGTEAEAATVRAAALTLPYDYAVTPCSDRELRANIELALCRYDAARAVHELEGFFAVSINLFCFLDFNGHFRRLNEAWERTLGFTREELMARPFIEFVHPDDRARTLQQNATVRSGGQASGFENRYLCKDGTYRWLQWNATPYAAERVIYSVARDVTAQKQAEAERTRLVSELQESLAEVRTLQEILPICSYCKKIRDDENYWQTVESYISQHTKTRFSHGICPTCLATHVEPQFTERE